MSFYKQQLDFNSEDAFFGTHDMEMKLVEMIEIVVENFEKSNFKIQF